MVFNTFRKLLLSFKCGSFLFIFIPKIMCVFVFWFGFWFFDISSDLIFTVTYYITYPNIDLCVRRWTCKCKCSFGFCFFFLPFFRHKQIENTYRYKMVSLHTVYSVQQITFAKRILLLYKYFTLRLNRNCVMWYDRPQFHIHREREKKELNVRRAFLHWEIEFCLCPNSLAS